MLEFFGACTIDNSPFLVCALKVNGDTISYLYHHSDAVRKGIVSVNLRLGYMFHCNQLPFSYVTHLQASSTSTITM